MINESYVDNYSWSQWIVQTLILRPFIPRFDEKKLYDLVNNYKNANPVNLNGREGLSKLKIVPTRIKNEFKVSLQENYACPVYVISNNGKDDDMLDGPIVIYLHGGAYVYSFIDQHFDTAATILKSMNLGSFFMVDYPLAPGVNYEKLFMAVESTYHQIIAAYPNNEIILMGDSAGGGIALGLSQRLAAAKIQGRRGIERIASVLLLSPWLDISMSDPESKRIATLDPFLDVNGLKKAGELLASGENSIELSNPLVSPLFGILEGLPSLNIWVGTHDILLPDSKRLLRRFKDENPSSNLRYFEKHGLIHCFHMLPGTGTPETFEEIVAAMTEDINSFKLMADQSIKLKS